MPEYRALREKHTLLTLCRTPELAVEVTLQPLRALGVDAAILFSDLLLPLEPLGIPFDFEAGEGPVIEKPAAHARPTSTPCAASSRARSSAWCWRPSACCGASSTAGPAHRLRGRALHAGLVRDRGRPLEQLRAHQAADVRGPRRLAPPGRAAGRASWPTTCARRSRPARRPLQLFDSWVGALDAGRLPRVRPAARAGALRRPARTRACPLIHFGTGTGHLLALQREAGGDVIGLDWRTPLDEGWARVGPTAWPCRATSTPRCSSAPASACSRAWTTCCGAPRGRPGHVFNLGHGILPGTPVENVKAVVEHVHARTARREPARLVPDPPPVAVVGGGIAGLAAAHASRRGRPFVLLEARRPLGRRRADRAPGRLPARGRAGRLLRAEARRAGAVPHARPRRPHRPDEPGPAHGLRGPPRAPSPDARGHGAGRCRRASCPCLRSGLFSWPASCAWAWSRSCPPGRAAATSRSRPSCGGGSGARRSSGSATRCSAASMPATPSAFRSARRSRGWSTWRRSTAASCAACGARAGGRAARARLRLARGGACRARGRARGPASRRRLADASSRTRDRAHRRRLGAEARRFRRCSAEAVVLAVPPRAAAPLVAGLAAEAADDLSGIRFASTVVVLLGFRREDVGHPLDGYGLLVPRSEGLRRPPRASSPRSSPAARPRGTSAAGLPRRHP